MVHGHLGIRPGDRGVIIFSAGGPRHTLLEPLQVAWSAAWTKRGPARTQTIRTLAGPLTPSSLSAATRPPTPRKLAQQQGLAPRSDTADGRRSDMRRRTSRGQLTSVRSRLDNFGEMLSVGLQRQAEGTGEV